ncbi:MAG: hypothetical protein HOE19_01505 [Candidatus Komeilibacteria bacterium]|jgi:hypothetical protein|nr:hypothetical protein [Candidatus Komeilibacteria bacterium]MBT4447220.1 hypothetical protein [Candidatus Komeilibacteria bacterium]
MINFSRRQHIASQIILLLIILANIYWWQSSIIGIIFGVFYLWLNSKKISDIYAENIHKGLRNIIGLISIFAYTSIVYTLFYHIYEINTWTFLFVFISISLIVEISSYHFRTKHYFFNDANLNYIKPSKIRKSFLPMANIILNILLFIVLFKKSSLGIIRSPWELVGYKFWLVFLLSNIFLVASLVDKKSYKNILLVSLHFLLLTSIAIIVYPLGYGYDSFIHSAALKTIAETGTIQPRLFLYIGQYGLTFFTQNLLQISLVNANKILLPFLFALLWPSTLFYGLRYGFAWTFQNSYLATIWSTFIGFSFAIMTTPQSFSYLLAAIFIFLLPEMNRRRISLYFGLIISLMTITVHPLVGISLLSFTALLVVWRNQNRHILWTKVIKPLTYFFNIIMLPSLFAIYQRLSGVAWADIFHFKLWPLFELHPITWLATYSFPLDMLHNLEQNKLWVYALVILLGIYFIFKENKLLFFKRLMIFSAILIANYLLTTILLSFNLQIDYQKNDYINRISYLIILFLLPIFLTALYFLFNATLKNNNKFGKIFILVISVFFISFGTYFSYPIYDKHANSKSFNVTAADLKTVEIIEQDANNQDYIVLANQMVGVAAIDTYGFAHYYNDNFYYSMPLGTNNIYQNYLSMIENDANRDEALIAMDKANVDKLYFVVNNYWHSAKQAIFQATNSADSKILVDDGINTIFVYQR